MVVLPEAQSWISGRRGPPKTRIPGWTGRFEGSEVVLHVYWADPDDAGVEILEYLGSSFYYGRYRYVTSLPILTDDSGRAAYGLGGSGLGSAGRLLLCSPAALTDVVFGLLQLGSRSDERRRRASRLSPGMAEKRFRSSWLRSLLAGEVGDKHLG